MQKIKILGNSVRITTDLTAEEIKNLQKYSPSSLVLVRETEDKCTEEYFRIAYKEGRDGITDFGITFPAVNGAGKATITALIPSNVTDKKAFVADNFGNVIKNLLEVEKQAKKGLTEVAKNKATIEAMIEVIED
jgi:hypothetical protein